MNGQFNIHVKQPIFKDEQLEVTEEGENIALRIGNTTFRFHYEDALKISQMIRVHAKQAKKRAGDNSRHWSVVGTLEGMIQ